MKKLFLYSAVALLSLATAATVEAKEKDKRTYRRGHRVVHVRHDRVVKRNRVVHVEHDRVRDRYYTSHSDRTRNIYVIEHNRPVQRVVYVGDNGRYYRWIDGERVYVRERYYDSYPSRYYYRDGRPRVNIHFSL